MGTLRKAGILAPLFSITNLYVHYAVDVCPMTAPTETALNFASPLREPVWQQCRTPGLIAHVQGVQRNRQQVKGIFATGLRPHCYVGFGAEHPRLLIASNTACLGISVEIRIAYKLVCIAAQSMARHFACSMPYYNR